MFGGRGGPTHLRMAGAHPTPSSQARRRLLLLDHACDLLGRLAEIILQTYPKFSCAMSSRSLSRRSNHGGCNGYDGEAIDTNFIELTAEIVAAYVAKNSIQASGLPELIASVHAAVTSLDGRAVAIPETQAPAVNPKRSVFPDYIICLDDGKKFKSLKRHLAALGMTPTEYRAKWGLAKDYPMVAPSYAAARSETG